MFFYTRSSEYSSFIFYDATITYWSSFAYVKDLQWMVLLRNLYIQSMLKKSKRAHSLLQPAMNFALFMMAQWFPTQRFEIKAYQRQQVPILQECLQRTLQETSLLNRTEISNAFEVIRLESLELDELLVLLNARNNIQETNTLRGLNPEVEIRPIKESINDIAKEASNDDYKLIDIIINCLNKLPQLERLHDDIGEAELIGTYLDPIIGPLFHDPENNKHFRWLNIKVEETESTRPDGQMFTLDQRIIKLSSGCVEAKPERTRTITKKSHKDTLKLVTFCKNTFDKQNVKAVMAIQAVDSGFYVSIYSFSLETTELYVMTELFSFTVPKCISELPMFIMNFDGLKKIMLSHENNCIFSSSNIIFKKRPSLQKETLDKIINTRKPKRVKPNLSFK